MRGWRAAQLGLLLAISVAPAGEPALDRGERAAPFHAGPRLREPLPLAAAERDVLGETARVSFVTSDLPERRPAAPAPIVAVADLELLASVSARSAALPEPSAGALLALTLGLGVRLRQRARR